MMNLKFFRHVGAFGMFALLSFASPNCSRSDPAPSDGESNHDDANADSPSNVVPVPATVRSNLGIRFAKVERRAVASTIRIPGRFEVAPDQLNEYRAPVAGRVDVLVRQLETVSAATPLYRIHSPQWRALQRELADADSEIRAAEAEGKSFGPLREAHAVHERSLFEAAELWRERVHQLEKVQQTGGGAAEALALARATLSSTNAEYGDVREKDAELDARQVTVAAAREAALTRFELLLATAGTLLGAEPETLLGIDESTGKPAWQIIPQVEIRAIADGVVSAVGKTTGSWVDESAPVLTVIDPRKLRFRAHGLQSDLLRFADGQDCAVVPASTADIDTHAPMIGKLQVGTLADPDSRSIDLFTEPADLAPWARVGVTAFLEVTTEKRANEMAIPRTAVARDGLTPVIFRRNPRNPDEVIRLEADLGLDDGRFIVINSGVADGDEVVIDGVYQLMLATSGSAQKGGHFHSDGTFHGEGEGDD